MKDVALSRYGLASSEPWPVNRMMAEFASGFRDGVDINVGDGYVNEETIPAAEMHRAFGVVIERPDKYRQQNPRLTGPGFRI